LLTITTPSGRACGIVIPNTQATPSISEARQRSLQTLRCFGLPRPASYPASHRVCGALQCFGLVSHQCCLRRIPTADCQNSLQPLPRCRRRVVQQNLFDHLVGARRKSGRGLEGVETIEGNLGGSGTLDPPAFPKHRSRSADRRPDLCASISHQRRTVSIIVTTLTVPNRATNRRSPCVAARPQPSATSDESTTSSRTPGSIRVLSSRGVAQRPWALTLSLNAGDHSQPREADCEPTN
jgi:hypothetical protein